MNPDRRLRAALGTGQPWAYNLVVVRLGAVPGWDDLIAQATVDCYNDSECVTGFYTMLEEQLELPFQTSVLGVAVTVVGIDSTNDDQIVAVCVRGQSRQRVPILEVPLPMPPPDGAEWIEAYRHWGR